MLAVGYSGNGLGLNNPAMTNVKDCGPLPAGYYSIGSPINDEVAGNYALPLTPDATNEMFGRFAFFCHGDNPQMNHSASDGCIVLPLFARNRIGESGDNNLQVIASLNGPPPEEWSVT